MQTSVRGTYLQGREPPSLGLVPFSFFFPGPHLQHTKVSRLGVESELLLLAYAIAIATQDPSCV